jgi:hypothetical protein
LYEIAVRVDRRCEMKGSDFDKAVASMRDTPKIPFTTIAVGQRVRVRFLQEYGDRLVLWRHERVPLGNGRYGRVTCFLNEEYKDIANGHCPYCAEGYRRKAVAFWLVWNHDTKRVEILSANQTAFSFVSMVKEFAEMQGTITDRDWIITVSVTKARAVIRAGTPPCQDNHCHSASQRARVFRHTRTW